MHSAIGGIMCAWVKRPKYPCIICNERAGIHHTQDGIVCNVCMPRELLKDCGTLSAYQIRSYHKLHRNVHWENCEFLENDNSVEETPSEDRSRVITTFDTIILADELNEQTATAESIDIVVSFILCSGLNDIIDSLRRFTRHGKLRVITTTYMGTTEYEALDMLVRLPNTEVKIELNGDEYRLHAKAFLFNRSDGRSTAYVGSANLSHSALTTGEEWEVKIREQDLPEAVNDVRLSFEKLWGSPHFTSVTLSNRAQIESELGKYKRGRT